MSGRYIVVSAPPSAFPDDARHFVASVRQFGGDLGLMTPEDGDFYIEDLPPEACGLILTSGEDIDPRRYGEAPLVETDANTERDQFELGLLSAALRRDIPVLGVCRGNQLINVAFGGKLIQDVKGHDVDERDRSTWHEVEVLPGGHLGRLVVPGRYVVPSRHHQAVGTLGVGLRVAAYSIRDGLIEAVESQEHRFVLGIQFHPERPESRHMFVRLWKSFLEECYRVPGGGSGCTGQA